MKLKKRVGNGCQMYPFQVMDILNVEGKPKSKYYVVLRYFKYFFADEISKIPPRREIDYSIDLI